MVWKLFRAGMWGIKGVLLFISFGMLLAWCRSYTHPGVTEGEFFEVGSTSMEWTRYEMGWSSGRICLGYSNINATTEQELRVLEIFSGEPKERGYGWRVQQMSGEHFWSERQTERPSLTKEWGPFRWLEMRSNEFFGLGLMTVRRVTLPCWLLALTAGLWPLTSLALLLRRRRRLRKLRRSGCCLHCGYDLRAALDDPAGRCPECGTVREGSGSSGVPSDAGV